MTPLDTAATVLAMHDITGNAAEVARRMNMPARTVDEIVGGYKRWGEIAKGPIVTQLRAEQKAILCQASLAIAAQCVKQVEKKLPDASAYQAAGIYGLMRTHARLDMGESTENVALVARVDATNADQLAARLSRRLVKPV